MPVRKAARLSVGLSPRSARWGWRLPPMPGKKRSDRVIYDLTGPLAAAARSCNNFRRQDHARPVRQARRRGYKIEPSTRRQSKPDIAINEAVRLIEQEKVDMLLGFYSSRSARRGRRSSSSRSSCGITTCISSAVLDGKNYKYCSGRRRAATSSADDDGFHRADSQSKLARSQRICASPSFMKRRLCVDVSKVTRPAPRRRLPGGAQGRLFRHRARSLALVPKLKRRPARRDLPYRLQSGTHALAAAGARQG